MKNNIFDTRRFASYFVYDLKNARSNYGLALLILGCFPAILYVLWVLFNTIWGDHWTSPAFGVRVGMFFLCMLILTLSFPSGHYGRLTDKRKGADWLMLPASRLEKFLSMILVSFVAIPLLFICFYNLTDWLLSVFDPTYGKALVAFRINDLLFQELSVDGEQMLWLSGNGLWIIWLNIVSNMLTFLLGALYFRKHKISATILCTIVASIAFSTVLSLLAVSGSFDGLGDYLMELEYGSHYARNLEWRINLLLLLPSLLIDCALLTAVWFRLKTLKH